MLTKREHAALAIYLADEDVDAIAAVHLADELFDVLDTPAELRDEGTSPAVYSGPGFADWGTE